MPVSHGYPDYGRFQAHADKLLDFQSNALTDGLVIRPRIFVGDIPYVGLNMLAIVNNFEFQTFFYSAQTGGQLLCSQSYGVRQDTRGEFAVPTGGPWLEMRIAAVSAGSEYTYSIYSAHSPLRMFFGNAQTAILLDQLGATIAAGATLSFDAPRVIPGEAHWFGTLSSGVSYRIRLLSVNAFGTFNLIDSIDGTSPALSRKVFLPACNVRIEVFNNDASPRNYLFSLVTRPIAQGW